MATLLVSVIQFSIFFFVGKDWDREGPIDNPNIILGSIVASVAFVLIGFVHSGYEGSPMSGEQLAGAVFRVCLVGGLAAFLGCQFRTTSTHHATAGADRSVVREDENNAVAMEPNPHGENRAATEPDAHLVTAALGILGSYTAVLASRWDAVMPESALPYPKEAIANAYKIVGMAERARGALDGRKLEGICTGFLTLAAFVSDDLAVTYTKALDAPGRVQGLGPDVSLADLQALVAEAPPSTITEVNEVVERERDRLYQELTSFFVMLDRLYPRERAKPPVPFWA